MGVEGGKCGLRKCDAESMLGCTRARWGVGVGKDGKWKRAGVCFDDTQANKNQQPLTHIHALTLTRARSLSLKPHAQSHDKHAHTLAHTPTDTHKHKHEAGTCEHAAVWRCSRVAPLGPSHHLHKVALNKNRIARLAAVIAASTRSSSVGMVSQNSSRGEGGGEIAKDRREAGAVWGSG